jgi:gamma-glutamylcyclotransferase (GGCT)/AIG2-like uncharacterized protein YtfP
MKRICVYGSLRVGEYNYNYFKSRYGEDMKYIRTVMLEGYKLYSLGSYPGIKESQGVETLLVDILEVSEDLYYSITEMELGAGYSCKQLNIDGIDTTLYVYEGPVSDKNLVESGDWSNYLKENNKHEIIR